MWADIINTIVTLATTGGVVYLIIEKLFERKRSKAETKTVEISNSNDVADLYNKIDDIVERKNAIVTVFEHVHAALERINVSVYLVKRHAHLTERAQERRTEVCNLVCRSPFLFEQVQYVVDCVNE